jgi:hypothetical protein
VSAVRMLRTQHYASYLAHMCQSSGEPVANRRISAISASHRARPAIAVGHAGGANRKGDTRDIRRQRVAEDACPAESGAEKAD